MNTNNSPNLLDRTAPHNRQIYEHQKGVACTRVHGVPEPGQPNLNRPIPPKVGLHSFVPVGYYADIVFHLIPQTLCVVVEARSKSWVVWAEGLFQDGDGSGMQGFGLVEVSLQSVGQHVPHVIQTAKSRCVRNMLIQGQQTENTIRGEGGPYTSNIA